MNASELLGKRVRVLDEHQQPTSMIGIAFRLRHVSGVRVIDVMVDKREHSIIATRLRPEPESVAV